MKNPSNSWHRFRVKRLSEVLSGGPFDSNTTSFIRGALSEEKYSANLDRRFDPLMMKNPEGTKVKKIIAVSYDDNVRWIRSKQKIKDAFESGLELVVKYIEDNQEYIDLASYMKGKIVMVGNSTYIVGDKGLKYVSGKKSNNPRDLWDWYGQHVKIKPGYGMKEFSGKTGTVIGVEDEYLRVSLDNSIHIPGVGWVSDDLWMPSSLNKVKSTNPRKKVKSYNPNQDWHQRREDFLVSTLKDTHDPDDERYVNARIDKNGYAWLAGQYGLGARDVHPLKTNPKNKRKNSKLTAGVDGLALISIGVLAYLIYRNRNQS